MPKYEDKFANFDSSLMIKILKSAFLIVFILAVAAPVLINLDRWYISFACGCWLIISYLYKQKILNKAWYNFFFGIIDFIAMLVIADSVQRSNDYITMLYILLLGGQMIYTPFFKSVLYFIFYFVCITAIMLITGNVTPTATSIASFAASKFIVLGIIFGMLALTLSLLKRTSELNTALKEVTEKEQELIEANKIIEQSATFEERNRIAKQIHDTTGHSITTIIMQTEAAKLIIDKNPKDAKQKIVSCHMTAVNALEELRESVRVLSGTGNTFNLKEKLAHTIIETTDNTGVIIRTRVDDNLIIPEEKAKFVYSTFKEGLNNGIRHGKATAFFFELTQKEDGIHFTLSDNGVGVKDIEQGFGLSHMTETAEKLGIKISLESAEDEGFEINMII